VSTWTPGLTTAAYGDSAAGAGSYTFYILNEGDGNHSVGISPAYTITVSKAAPTGSFGAETLTYGTSLSGLLNATFVNPYNTAITSPTGTVTYSASGYGAVSAGTVLPPGTYTITASYPGDSNYNATTKTATFTVNRAALTITANNASKVYASANPGFSASYSGFVNGDTSSVVSGLSIATTAVTGSGAGTYPITASGASAANYSISYVGGTLTVSQAPLTITANNASKAYGSANPSFSASYSGFVNGDTSSVVSNLGITSNAAAGSSVGTYAITPSGASAANYSISYVVGTLTVGQASLTITANNASRAYGAANPGFSASYVGFVNGDTSSVVSGLGIATTATTGSAIGAYLITPSGASATNYSISYVNGTLTIG
jgi:hypothetical protein